MMALADPPELVPPLCLRILDAWRPWRSQKTCCLAECTVRRASVRSWNPHPRLLKGFSSEPMHISLGKATTVSTSPSTPVTSTKQWLTARRFREKIPRVDEPVGTAA